MGVTGGEGPTGGGEFGGTTNLNRCARILTLDPGFQLQDLLATDPDFPASRSGKAKS